MIACGAPFHILDLLPFLGALAGGGGLVAFRATFRDIMHKIIPYFFGLTLLITGCASTPRRQALKIAEISDATMDGLAQALRTYATNKVDECRALDLPTPREREVCVGDLNMRARIAVDLAETVAEAQRAIFLANKCTVQRRKMTPQELVQCAEEYDWVVLGDNVRAATLALTPYLESVNK